MCLQVWDPEESRRERDIEHRRKEERARRKAEKKAAALARLARMEAAEAAEAAAAATAAAAAAAGGADAPGAGGAAAAAGGADGAAEVGSRLKRRRTASVDYQALNAQLEAAAAAARAPIAADAPAGDS